MDIPLYALCKTTREEAADIVENIINENGECTDKCRELELQMCEMAGVKYTRVTHCISSALRNVLLSWSVCQGEAVFVSSFANSYDIFAVMECGATPILVDCDRETWCMSPEKLEAAVKKCIKNNELYPRAVIVNDTFGMPFDADRINDVCARYGLLLVEDATGAMGGEYKGRKTCSLGDAAVTSFQPPMNIEKSDRGGAALTDNSQLAKTLKITAAGGMKVFSNATGAKEMVRRGSVSTMSEFAAAALSVRLKNLDERISRRRRNTEKLKKATEGTKLRFQKENEGVAGSCPVFAVCAPDKESMEQMVGFFKSDGIECEAIYSKPMCRNAALKDFGYLVSDLPVGSDISVCSFMLPCHEELTDEQVDFVCKAIKKYCI